MLKEYVAAIHIHSDFSDGLRPIPEITRIAARAGIDILLFADHMTLEPLSRGMQRWYGSVLSVIGYEINDPKNINHYLAYGLTETLPADLEATDYVRRVRELDGTGFIAHPDEKRPQFPDVPPYPWTAWDAEEYDGIEIWNHSSEWLEKLTNFNKYFHVLHPLRGLKGPETETLERWDALNEERRVVGIGGLDAHAFPYRLGPVTLYIFRYKVLFRGVKTHILVEGELDRENGDSAAKTVIDTLKAARCYIANHRWGDAGGFRFSAETAGKTFQMGDDISTGDEVTFRVSSPLKGMITLLRNGEQTASASGKDLTVRTAVPGAYRVEVTRSDKPWIYSNHIRIRGNNIDE
jgi:hypothetical protein